jgi:hypothetical protein
LQRLCVSLSLHLLLFPIVFLLLQICISPQQIIVYLTGKLNQKLVILTFGQFEHLVILDKSI